MKQNQSSFGQRSTSGIAYGRSISATTASDPVEIARGLSVVFASRAAHHDRTGTFPSDDVADLRVSGLLGLLVPEHLGGMGASFLTFANVAREIATGNGATALVFNMHTSVTGALSTIPDELALALGADEVFFSMRDEVLSRAAGGALYQVAMSEHGAGARFSAMQTKYSRCVHGWHIQGRKAFCTGAGHADAYLVAARSDDGARVSQFLVPSGTGIDVDETWDSVGMRATASHDLVLDTCVATRCLLGGVEGLAPLLASAMPQWLVASYAAVYVGVADAAIRAAVAQIVPRGLGELSSVRARLGRADATTQAAWLATQEAARRVDLSPGAPETNQSVYRAKLLAGDNAMAVAASMIEACGASSLRKGGELERLFRDARCGSVQPATSDVCADWLGVVALGLDPNADAMVPRW